jgi:hypothetical protein
MHGLLLWISLATAPGRITGTVSDPGGLALPGVQVTVRGAVLAEPREATTDADGRYTIDALAPGIDDLTFRLPHFTSGLERQVEVEATTVRRVDATPSLRTTADVVVTESATFRGMSSLSSTEELLGIADAAASGVITSAQIPRPPSPAPADLLERVPGVVIEDGAVRSPASTLASAQAIYRLSGRLRLQVELLNALDARASDVEYFYSSRLPGEPAEGVADVHLHPVAPRTVRVGIKTTF